VQKGLSLSGQELLVIDIGGGSTEFIRGNESGVTHALSINLGSVRLTERYLRSDPVVAEEFADMRSAIDLELEPLGQHWRDLPAPSTWVGIAGTFTTLAAVEKNLIRYSHSMVHGSNLTHHEIQRQVRLFQSKTLAERKNIPGLEPKRADVILAGACIIDRMMTMYGARRLLVSDQGVRYGLLYEHLGRG
jgi:exopolyphosphatase / guanosine-5'-triphosphate,3'-diphosphate pyrophosphatase